MGEDKKKVENEGPEEASQKNDEENENKDGKVSEKEETIREKNGSSPRIKVSEGKKDSVISFQIPDDWSNDLGELSSEYMTLADVIGFTSASGNLLDGTTISLSRDVEKIKDQLDGVSASISDIRESFDAKKVEQMESELREILETVDEIEDSRITELKDLRERIDVHEQFVSQSTKFLVEAESLKGKTIGLEEKYSGISEHVGSIDKRLKHVESAVLRVWERRVTVISVVIAAIAVIVAVLK